MKILTIGLIMISILTLAVGFSIGAFEYNSGPSMYAKFDIDKEVGPFEFALTHWIFWRIYDFGFYNFPQRITPFNWQSRGGWWDVSVKLNFTDSFYFKFLHRSEHNFDGLDYLKIHWYNFFELGLNW